MNIPVPDEYYDMLKSLADQDNDAKLNDIFRIFDKWCKTNAKPVVLMIDEVDTATNNQVFLDFLGKLRSGYLKKEKNPNYKTFQSVILAGVTDIKHLKAKIRDNGDSKENSPWNIAADFTIDMSLSADGIKGMLDDYESDHHTGMDTGKIAGIIRDYTSGYPFLVSRICEKIDVDVSKSMGLKAAWTSAGIDEAVKMILAEGNSNYKLKCHKFASNDCGEIKIDDGCQIDSTNACEVKSGETLPEGKNVIIMKLDINVKE